MVAPIGAGFGALKNEFSMFCSTSVPNFMLVDKSAQYPPKISLRAWTSSGFHVLVLVLLRVLSF